MLNKATLYLPATIWLLAILFLSGFPGHKVPAAPFWQFDKLVHGLIYAILAFFILIPYYQQYKELKTRYVTISLVLAFSVFYGGFMEILQHYIFINRSGNVYDFIANTIGAVLGVLSFPYIVKLLPINKWLG